MVHNALLSIVALELVGSPNFTAEKWCRINGGEISKYIKIPKSIMNFEEVCNNLLLIIKMLSHKIV